MTQPTITDDTPCFHIDVTYVSREFFEKYGEESKRTHWSRTDWYVDGLKEKAEKQFNEYVELLKSRGDVIIRAYCDELDEYYRNLRRQPRRSVIANWGTCDLRSF
jgi:hypothetical protein